MSVIAIIPARKGSKRLPGKNSRLLGGRPLAKWTVDCAIDSGIFDKIVFSTDDANLAEMAQEWGCLVPGLRAEYLAKDTTDLVSVCLNISDNKDLQINDEDILFLLQPTSPYRKPETIQRAFHLIKNNDALNVVSFSKSKVKPEWLHFSDYEGNMKSIIKDGNLKEQVSSNCYWIPNGLIYALYVSVLKKHKSFFTQKTTPLICKDFSESIDIDEQSDWDLAEFYLCKK